MLEVARCVALDHDPGMLALAAIVCVIGASALTQMHERARHAAGTQRLGWIFFSALAAGATVWCTHFVAMLGYTANLPVGLDPVLTLISLVVAVAGSGVGFAVAGRGHTRLQSAVGGALVGVAIAAMHFIGMAAYRIDGIVSWQPGFVAAAICCATLFSAAALLVLNRQDDSSHRLKVGTALMVLAVVGLHFTAMTAMNVSVMPLSEEPLSRDELLVLGVGTALVGMLVIMARIAAALIDRRTREDALGELRHMAMTDSLTGLPNRNCFNLEIETRLEHARAAGHRKALAVIDLVRFKEVNDVNGHAIGDAVLKQFAQRLSSGLRPGEFASRLGGDEFVVVKGFDDEAELNGLVRRLENLTREPLRTGQVEVLVGASIGLSVFPDDAADASTLLGNADLAMFRAKERQSRDVCFYDLETDDLTRSQRELATDLRKAMADGTQLAMHYQVQASVGAREVSGFEALIRWHHSEKGMIPPSDFIPLAEENGMILELGEWVLRRACSDAAGWTHGAKVAVNMSPLQLLHPGLPQLVHEVLLSSGLPPRRLEIELTESAIMSDREHSLRTLRQIKALGVGVALDDFGTGYSSLETLRIFPFDKIKLDRFFLSEITVSDQAKAMVRAVIALGKSLGVPILAEGIEEENQLRILEEEGCDEAQGYLLGRPGPEAVAVISAAARPAARLEAEDRAVA